MNPVLYIGCFLPLIIVLFMQRKQQKFILKKMIKSKKKGIGGARMVELIKRYIGKDCYVYTMDSHVRGIITEMKDGWIVVDNKGKENLVNLDFVTRIQEIAKKPK